MLNTPESKTVVSFPDKNTVRCVTIDGKEKSIPSHQKYFVHHLPKVGSQSYWCRLIDVETHEEIHVEERLVLSQGIFESKAKLARLYIIDPELRLLSEWSDLLREVCKDIPAEVLVCNTKYYVNRMIIALKASLKEDFALDVNGMSGDFAQTYIDLAKLELSDIDRPALIAKQMETHKLHHRDRLHLFTNITTIADAVYRFPDAIIDRISCPTKEKVAANLHRSMLRALENTEP